MKYSIVVATYNRKKLLDEMIHNLMHQDFSQNEYEVLLIDDGSIDGTKEEIIALQQQYHNRLKVHFSNHDGPARARNWGIFNAAGEYVVFTDDDCLVPIDWLTQINKAFQRHPDVVGVSGMQEPSSNTRSKNIFAEFEVSAPMGDYNNEPNKEYVGGKDDFIGGATNNVAYRRSVLLEVNGFDETFPFAAAEDADLTLRILSLGYTMVHTPIRVVHRQEYSFKRLMGQAFVRGVSGKYFNIKHGLPSSFFRIALSSLKVCMRSLTLLFSSTFYVYPVVLAYQSSFLWGVVSYNRVMRERGKMK